VGGCQNGQELIGSSMKDYYNLGLLDTLEVGFVQLYYATGFTPPSILTNSGFTLPGVPSLGPAVPLLIKDAYNSCQALMGRPITLIAGQPVRLALSYVGIDGDNGPAPATGCAPPTH
jgi:hypothetical protein